MTMTTTVNQLARSFGTVVRQIADLLMMLQDYHALVPNLSVVLDISSTEVLELQVNTHGLTWWIKGHFPPEHESALFLAL